MSYQDFPANVLARSSLLVNMSELSEVPEKSILESQASPYKILPSRLTWYTPSTGTRRKTPSPSARWTRLRLWCKNGQIGHRGGLCILSRQRSFPRVFIFSSSFSLSYSVSSWCSCSSSSSWLESTGQSRIRVGRWILREEDWWKFRCWKMNIFTCFSFDMFTLFV